MNTTAGICSTRARYLASTLSKGPCEFVSASGVSVESKVGLENGDCCCKKTAANSCKAFSASNRAAASRVASVSCLGSLSQLACFRKSSAIFHLLHRWPAACAAHNNGLRQSHARCLVRRASFLAVASPRRFLIQRRLRESPQRVNRAAVRHHRTRRKQRSRRLIHEWHELVREARHSATDADAADVGTSSDSSHPAALSDVALHHRAPTSQLHDARRRSVRVRKLRLLVVSAAVATFVHRRAEKPGRPQNIVQRNH